MKNLLKSLLLVGAVSLTAVGCASHDASSDDSASTAAPVATESSADAAPAPTPAAAAAASNHNSVFFGFNEYNVNQEYKDIIKTNADYLVATPAAKVRLEGNTDTVGSVEYNVALGQKRAVAVKKSLVALGANGKNIEAVSNGLSKPLEGGKKVEKNAINRRTDIIYTTSAPAGYSFDKTPQVNSTFFAGTVEAGVQ